MEHSRQAGASRHPDAGDFAGATAVPDPGAEPSRGENDRRNTARAHWSSPGTSAQVLLLLAATYFVYAGATRFPFVYDDSFQILQNENLDSWRFLPAYFTRHVWSHIPQMPASYYRPFFLLWLRLNNLVFQHEPSGWHLTTILWHVLATLLVYCLTVRLLRNRAAGIAAALLFGTHPVHVEAVAWISGVTEPMSAALFLGAVLAYLRSRQSEKSGRWVAWSLLLFTAALLTKETVVVLPLVLMAYEATIGTSRDVEKQPALPARKTVLHLFYWAVLAGYLLVRWLVLGGMVHSSEASPLWSSLLAWPWLLCFYLREWFWPSNLSPLYNPPTVTGIAQWTFLGPALGVVMLGFLAFLSAKRKPGVSTFAIAWFLLTLAPAFAAFCAAPPTDAFHDRYLYLPSVGLCLMVGAIARPLFVSRSYAVRYAALAGILAIGGGLAVLTRKQLPYWSSNYALFERASLVAPMNETANLNFAAELIKTREYRRALEISRKILTYHPDSSKALGSAGEAAFLMGDFLQAETCYIQATRLDPNRSVLFYYLGLTRIKLGRDADALDPLRAALAHDPPAGTHYLLGQALAHLGHWQQAAQEYRAELERNPDNIAARLGLRESESRVAGQARGTAH